MHAFHPPVLTAYALVFLVCGMVIVWILRKVRVPSSTFFACSVSLLPAGIAISWFQWFFYVLGHRGGFGPVSIDQVVHWHSVSLWAGLLSTMILHVSTGYWSAKSALREQNPG